jgi:hypothetical protein
MTLIHFIVCKIPCLQVYKPQFWREFTLQNWGAAYARNIVLLTTEPATPVLYVVKLPVESDIFETVILQAVARARMRQRIIGVSEYFDYMRVADIIDSQKSEDCDITD